LADSEESGEIAKQPETINLRLGHQQPFLSRPGKQP
jgi:hypothetical protein